LHDLGGRTELTSRYSISAEVTSEHVEYRAGPGVRNDPEPMLPTRGYRVLCHDATLIDLEAEAM
jgi:hypothetical protein